MPYKSTSDMNKVFALTFLCFASTMVAIMPDYHLTFLLQYKFGFIDAEQAVVLFKIGASVAAIFSGFISGISGIAKLIDWKEQRKIKRNGKNNS